jgi:hypothetical protein
MLLWLSVGRVHHEVVTEMSMFRHHFLSLKEGGTHRGRSTALSVGARSTASKDLATMTAVIGLAVSPNGVLYGPGVRTSVAPSTEGVCRRGTLDCFADSGTKDALDPG